MHKTQARLLDLAQKENLAQLSLRQISQRIGLGDDNARLVQHHIDQLVKKNFLWVDRRAGVMRILKDEASTTLMRVPIYGTASCGPATQYAEDKIESYLPISPGLLGLKLGKTYFALRAVGNSMNRARVPTLGNQKAGINDGDLVIVEKAIPDNLTAKPYVVAVMDGLANIKKLVMGDGYALLESESTVKYMPIYLDPSVESLIVGKVVGVVKA